MKGAAVFALTAVFAAAGPAAAAPAFEFVSPPNIELNRVFRLDKATGEVIACQFGLRNQGVGFTLCFSSGEGAGPQPVGDYGLVATHHQKEGGIFRVNYRTGDMSICYVSGVKVVCTPQSSRTALEPENRTTNTPGQ
ncbi:MAG: hypothetical protein LBR29_10815 [Methylobacteriaceae bacterium]|nr:hypothetical protein [Methylobacteriaceae bacterium]